MKIRYLSYLKEVAFSLIFLTLPFALMEQFIYQETSKSEDKIASGVLGIVLGLLENFLVLILLGYTIKKLQGSKISLGNYYKKHFRDLVIETFRGMGRIALGLLLIWPGIKRLIQYYLIPYVVQFDEEYIAGRVDALEESENLLKNKLLRFTGLLALTQIVAFVIEIASVNFNLFTSPLAWILFYMAENAFQVGVFLIFYNYYLKLKREDLKNQNIEVK